MMRLCLLPLLLCSASAVPNKNSYRRYKQEKEVCAPAPCCKGVEVVPSSRGGSLSYSTGAIEGEYPKGTLTRNASCPVSNAWDVKFNDSHGTVIEISSDDINRDPAVCQDGQFLAPNLVGIVSMECREETTA